MWRNRWYLAGLDAGTEWSPDSLRRFRLDRVETDRAPVLAVEPGTDAYAIPADFDPDAAFDLDPNSWGTDPLVRARIRVSPDHVDAFVDELGGDVLVEDGATFVDLDVRHYDSLRTRLLGFGTNAVVMSPPELVGLVRDHLAALAASDRGPES
jgi:predicted DNA-binding transcriptional regulator YafY